jgi:hypothetical protein
MNRSEFNPTPHCAQALPGSRKRLSERPGGMNSFPAAYQIEKNGHAQDYGKQNC